MSPVLDLLTEEQPARPKGLRGLWAWVRRSILRINNVAGGPSLKATPVSTESAEKADITEPVEPRGVKVREKRSRSVSTGALLSSIQEGLAAVPPLPHVVRGLLRELWDPSSNSRSVARIASSDPALAATLIRTVNSAAVGMRRKVTSVAEAVSYLGYTIVRSLVIRMRLEQMLPTKGEQAAYDAEDLWIHSLAVSHAADCLAERVRGVDRGFVSTLGLLHDIGKLAINSQFPESAKALRVISPDRPDESFLDRERRVLGADHAEIGAILATHWKLPHDFIEAIRWHHAPQNAPAGVAPGVRAAAGVVHLANQLAKYCYVYSEDMEIDIVGDELLNELGIPGPLTRLLNKRVRAAISRAFFFADESSTRPLGAIRRFLRLSNAEQAAPLLAHPKSRSVSEPRVRVYDSMPEGIFAEGPPVVEVTSRRASSVAEAGWRTAKHVRFIAKANAGGTTQLLAAATRHQDSLKLEEDVRMPARFLVRRLLPAISEISGGTGTVEVAQSLAGGRFIVGIRSEALAFEKRFGAEAAPRAALGVVEEELANVLNLRWFSEIRTTPDGGTLVFLGHPPRR